MDSLRRRRRKRRRTVGILLQIKMALNAFATQSMWMACCSFFCVVYHLSYQSYNEYRVELKLENIHTHKGNDTNRERKNPAKQVVNIITQMEEG